MSAIQGIKHEQVLHFSDGHVERQITPTVFNGKTGEVLVRFRALSVDGRRFSLITHGEDGGLMGTGLDHEGNAHYDEDEQ